MLYSWMNVDRDYYVSLHGEWILGHGKEIGCKKNILTGRAESGVLKKIMEENLHKERLFLDFTYIEEIEKETCRVLSGLLRGLLEKENEIYLMEVREPCAGCIRKELLEGKLAYTEEKAGEEGYCYAVYPKEMLTERLSASECRNITAQIFRENLLILMEEESQGKFFNIDRLLADEELCLQYFFYKLAVRLAAGGMVSGVPKENREVYMVPVNAYAMSMAAKIAEILGAKVSEKEDINRLQGTKNVILVRDVIHMSYEITRPAMHLMGRGTAAKGAAALVDIHTGIGQHKEYVTLYTIDLEKRIRYRMHKKQP